GRSRIVFDDNPRWEDPRDHNEDARDIEVHWMTMRRGPMSDREDEDPRERDEDVRHRDHDPRDPDPRDPFLDRLDLPRGLDREIVIDGRERYELNGDESRSLATVGAFRVVSERDLCDARDDSLELREHSLRHGPAGNFQAA